MTGKQSDEIQAERRAIAERRYCTITDLARVRDANMILRAIVPDMPGDHIPKSEHAHVLQCLLAWTKRLEDELIPENGNREQWLKQFPNYPPAQVMKDRLEAGEALYQVIRKRHYGRMPDEVQKAYDRFAELRPEKGE